MILEKIEQIGVVPVLTIENESKAIRIAEALTEGGIPAIEVTFRTESAEQAVETIAKKYPNMLIGAGTILNIEQADKAINAGAKFIVTPGFNPKVVEYCLKKEITILPGVNNPSSIEAALEMGIKTVKFFPSESSGGLNAIRALSAPYNMLKFVPTGGINLENLAEYMKFSKISACGTSFMATKEMIANDDYETITKLSLKAMKEVHNFKFLHLGIKSDGIDSGKINAYGLGSLFNLDVKEAMTSFYVGDGIEFMKEATTNHIGFSTNNVERAVAYLKSKGIFINENSKKYDDEGNLILVYLENEIAGHCIHIKKN